MSEIRSQATPAKDGLAAAIPYDEMRRLCGLPDIEHLDLMAVIRKHGLNQAISCMQLTGTFQQEEDGRIQWTPHPMTALFTAGDAG